MPEIALLSQETIDKIAAGEVVERPSSVVKELVENAIDAKATAVTVEIKEGGISLIRITDNGCGIAHSQVPTAFLRHSTSKIRSVDDLIGVASLGFRGEALSSIAAVAQVELITKTAGDLTGTRYVIEGSREKENEEIGAPDGATFLVRNLFYNTPARRKFLKTAQTEGNYISDLMERLALSHPDVSFRFISNGQTKLHTSGNSSEKDIIYHIYGRDITAAILPVNAAAELFSVKGYIAKPTVSRGNRNFENFFINGRYIRSSLLSKAVEDAYKGYLMQHQYPFCVLYITIDTELVDINVHPAKMELRFFRSEEIYQALMRLIRDVLAHRELIPEVPAEEKKAVKKEPVKAAPPEPFEKRRIAGIRSTMAETGSSRAGALPQQREIRPQAENRGVFEKLLSGDGPGSAVREENLYGTKKASAAASAAAGEPENGADMSPARAVPAAESAPPSGNGGDGEASAGRAEENAGSAFAQPQIYEQQSFFSEESGFLSPAAAKKHRIIGQLFDTYWLVEYEDRLFLIDQHAAHEKVLYENTMKRIRSRAMASQSVSPPVILTLSHEEQEVLEKYEEQIRAFGYGIESFGGKEYAVNAVPAEFGEIDTKQMLLGLLDDFTGLNGYSAPEQILEKVASMSCKAAVKGSQHFSSAEMEELLGRLLELDNPYHCPHGRPTIISMSRNEIEKKFRRIV